MPTIRVYPAGQAGGMYGANNPMYTQMYEDRLDHAEEIGDTQIGYEQALWQQRIQRAQLETMMEYGGPRPMMGGFGSQMVNPMMHQQALLGGRVAAMAPQVVHPGYGGYGGMGGLGRGGQVNLTNQVSTGAGNQSVTNNNHISRNITAVNRHLPMASPWGGHGGFGGFGGWLGGLMNWF